MPDITRMLLHTLLATKTRNVGSVRLVSQSFRAPLAIVTIRMKHTPDITIVFEDRGSSWSTMFDAICRTIVQPHQWIRSYSKPLGSLSSLKRSHNIAWNVLAILLLLQRARLTKPAPRALQPQSGAMHGIVFFVSSLGPRIPKVCCYSSSTGHHYLLMEGSLTICRTLVCTWPTKIVQDHVLVCIRRHVIVFSFELCNLCFIIWKRG